MLGSIFFELVSPIVEFLRCLALWFLGALEWLILGLLNLLIAAVMAAVSVVLALLPVVNLEHISLPPWLALIAYVMPLGYLLTLALLALGIELVWWAVQIVLKWAKVVG